MEAHLYQNMGRVLCQFSVSLSIYFSKVYLGMSDKPEVICVPEVASLTEHCHSATPPTFSLAEDLSL
jgi:hypothetical protein